MLYFYPLSSEKEDEVLRRPYTSIYSAFIIRSEKYRDLHFEWTIGTNSHYLIELVYDITKYIRDYVAPFNIQLAGILTDEDITIAAGIGMIIIFENNKFLWSIEY